MKEEKSHKLIRLNRYIANAGACTRREADALIKAGKIRVNGEIVREMGLKVSRTDTVQWEEKKLQARRRIYLLLNKPKGFFSRVSDTENPKHVMKLVEGACRERIYPIESMDKDMLGLLLFTNDGELTKQMTSAECDKKRVYSVQLDKPLRIEDKEKIASGFKSDGKLIPVEGISLIDEKDKSKVGIELHFGQSRMVHRIFQRFGYKVVKMDLVALAGLTKKNLKRGHWRMLTDKEVRNLKYF